MSWSATIRGTYHDLPSTLPDEIKAEAEKNNPSAGDVAEAAYDTALNFIADGFVGNRSRRYGIQLSGYSNPGHEPRAGYSRDFVNIRIEQEE